VDPGRCEPGGLRADLLRRTSFQIRFIEPLPDAATKPGFARWSTTRLRRLLLVHQWLVAELIAPRTKASTKKDAR
jgi:hypothetical protein